VTPFSFGFDLSELSSGADRPWMATPGTFYVAILDTGMAIPPLGEGVSYDGVPGRFAGLGGEILNQQFSFLGRYQPYGLYLPSTWDGETALPAALVLHGHGGSHSSYNQFPGFLDDFGEHPPTVLVTPLARGSSFYADYGEHEVLAVLDDVERRWSIDPERLYLTGYSMGGYGVYRLGALYPDRFAGAVVWAGYSGEFTGLPRGEAGSSIASGERDTTPTGDAVRNLESFLHLPVLHLTGTNDEIVPVTGQLAASRRLDDLGYRHRLDVYPGYEHLSFGIVDEWSEPRAWLGDARRETAPRDIALAVSEGWRSADLQPVLDLPGASAWWLTAVVQRDGRDDPLVNGDVAATSAALPGHDHTVTPTTDVVIEPTPHTRTGIAWTSGPAAAIDNRLDLALRNIGRVDVDLPRAGLVADGLEVVVETDGASNVVLGGPPDAVTLAVTASPRGATGSLDGERITLEVPGPGRWVFSMAAPHPAPAEPSAGAPAPLASLPATGGGGVPYEAVGLLALATAVRAISPRPAGHGRQAAHVRDGHPVAPLSGAGRARMAG
jgi:pimeloyl-ACP methyl ester carboxylesterase